jgi:5-(carboxyamino)imidazole ribonucleotide mutase
MTEPLVGIIMGSSSDWETMRHAADVLDQLGIPHETKIVSAHRTPKRLYDYAHSAKDRGLRLVIAGAGGAAHLPGMTASMTELPVLGVPIETQALKGMDSLLSIVQMPAGIPVGTLAIGKPGAINAGLLAAAILANGDAALGKRLRAWREAQTGSVAQAPR